MKFGTSKLANKYLGGLTGIEIGGAAHNPFCLNTINIDYTDDPYSPWANEQRRHGNEPLHVDILCNGEDIDIMFEENTYDFVLSSHSLEHIWNPIKALRAWIKVIKPGGYVFLVLPHREHDFSTVNLPSTTLAELILRDAGIAVNCRGGFIEHYNLWHIQDFLDLCRYLNLKVIETQSVDDKVGNGFTVVIQKG